MFYAALPPTPPAVTLNLIGESHLAQLPSSKDGVNVTSKKILQESLIRRSVNRGKVMTGVPRSIENRQNQLRQSTSKSKSVSKSQPKSNSGCKYSTILEPKKDAVNKLIVTSQTNVNNTVNQTSVNKQNIVPCPPITENKDNKLESKKIEIQNSSATVALDKIAQQNTMGKILATVQELINVSLYASVDQTVENSVEVPVKNQSDSRQNKEITAIKPTITSNLDSDNSNSDNSNPDNSSPKNYNSDIAKSESQKTKNQNSDNKDINNNQEVAIGTNINAAKLIAIIQDLISKSISNSLNSSQSNISINNQISTKLASTKLQDLDEKKESITQNQPQTKPQNKPKDNIPNNIRQRLAQINKDKEIALNPPIQLAQRPGEPFLVGIMINGREIGTIDIVRESDTLYVPLDNFAELARLTIEKSDDQLKIETPLGLVEISTDALKIIKGVAYLSKETLKEKLSINIELNTADLTLLADLPWRGGSQQARDLDVELNPEFFAPRNGISSFKQELNIYNNGGNTDLRSYTQIGGRLFGGSFRLRMNNDFDNQPNISEYFFYQRNGSSRYQIGKQRVSLHPLLNGVSLTGLQFGYSNIPSDRFNSSYGANELLSRRSRPVQTFRGQAPPASFVQLRIGGVVITQQQVGFDGKYEFIDVRLPTGQRNEIELVVFDRNNLRVPREIRSIRLNASDLLLPSKGNVQLAGLGLSGNIVQDAIFDDYTSSNEGDLVGFYQVRQGLSKNLTLEGSLQANHNNLQSQAGLVWRLANPVVFSASVGNSRDRLAYSADLDIQLSKLEINANSQSLPKGYRSSEDSSGRYNHSLEAKYRFSNKFNIGLIARHREQSGDSANYILPTFSMRPFSTLSLNGRPDIDGDYLFNAFYRPNSSTRLSLNTYGNAYISDLRYNLNSDYQVSLGTEFGRDLAPRYSIGFGHTSRSLRRPSWNLGLAYSDGDIGPLAGASMQVLPGLFTRVEYQGIPSRTKGSFGGFDNGRLSISLVSDLSFAAGKVTPARYSGVNKERGAIAGNLKVNGSKEKFELDGSVVRVYSSASKLVGTARTDNKGNFFIGNLNQGVYVVELEADALPIELAVQKNSSVVEVASSAVTRLDFPLRAEYGVAGRITDVSGQPIPQVQVELINGAGARVLSGNTDKFGLYRLDGVPVGNYTLRVSPQDSVGSLTNLPKRRVKVSQEFVYEQNLQLPISAAAKQKLVKQGEK
ncbi:MAG: carboxypeptidase regulatory-like domain-containing protein [Mastigocoleus sp.]